MIVNSRFYSVRAKNLLATNFITPVNGCLNLIQDNSKKVYKIPNFCINDPYFEKVVTTNKAEEKNEKEINVNFNF